MNKRLAVATMLLAVIPVFAGLTPPVVAQDVPVFTQDFPPAEFAQRREAVYDAIGPQGIAVVQGAPSPPGYTRFRQSNEFYYLCGVETPHAYLLMDGMERRTHLYLPSHDERRAR